ncbi:arsenite methyltransferase [Hemiscyllium ocellatum]|uniref:arsenite methyltransferase n=1 Tax=Hemiscyllium ocellatum TaxID=170820 RepID=UPI0029677430|nr:arsenite methyltransferase [Hemiscyllium ocellatum]
MSQKGTSIQDQLKSYYGKRLKSSEDLKTDVACSKTYVSLSKSATHAMRLIHPEVTQRYFGCGLVVPESLESCSVLDLGSGSGRDCYVLSKLVGPNGHVTGVDMTDEQVQLARKYISYHQEKFGFRETNIEFIQGYIEKLGDAGIQYNKFDVLVSNCVICLCPDKKAVFAEAYRILKEGGEMYFSDMYASEPVDEKLKEDSVLWGEGLAGALYWKELISLVKELGFSTPYLVAANHIEIHKADLLQKTGDVKYASGTYRFFKLPSDGSDKGAWATYKGTVTDHEEKLIFDSVHTFEKDKAVAVDGELALVLKTSRFASHFIVQPNDCEVPIKDGPQQYCHLNPFLLADKLGSSIQKCSKNQKDNPCEHQTEVTRKCGETKELTTCAKS